MCFRVGHQTFKAMDLLDVVILLRHCHWLPRNLFYDLRWNTSNKGTRWHILCDYCTGGNYRAFADGDTGKNLDACAEPHIVADGDGLCVFKPLVAALGIEWMSSRVEAAVGGDKHILAEHDLRAVENDETVVRVEVLAESYVRAVVAPERCLDANACADAADYLAQLCVFRGPVAGLDLVVLLALVLALVHEPHKLRIVVGVVQLAKVAQFLVGHSSSNLSILKITGRVPSEQQAIISFSFAIQPFMIEPPCKPV